MDISVDVEGDVLHHCLERMLVFCSLDAYEKYDMRDAQLNIEHCDAIHRDHLTCTNVMGARSELAAWASLMPGTDLMARLPTDVNLLDMDGTRWGEVEHDIWWVLSRMTGVKGIRLAAATKMLALKRPELIPACDSQLVEYFGPKQYRYGQGTSSCGMHWDGSRSILPRVLQEWGSCPAPFVGQPTATVPSK